MKRSCCGCKKLKTLIEKELSSIGGFLRLRPSWVARRPLKAGRRLGLKDEEYEVGERVTICERWLAPETEADIVLTGHIHKQ